MEGMINIVIDNAWEDISWYDKYAEELRKKSRVLRNREPVQEARIAFYSDKIAMREINTEFIDNVVLRLLWDIASETTGLNEFAKQTALRILLDAYAQQKGSSTQAANLNSTLLKMQTKHIGERKKDVHIIHHTV